MSRTGPPLSLADEAYVELRRRLTRCEIAPGTAFTARAVAADLGLGLTPVREALLQLGRERLVDTVPRRGYVAAPLTPARVDDILATWRVVTAHVAALAARRLPAADVPDLAGRLDAVFTDPLAAAGRPQVATVEARSTAWVRLAAATGNEILAEVVRFLDGQVLRVHLSAMQQLDPGRKAVAARARAELAARSPSWAEILGRRDEAAAAARAAEEVDASAPFLRVRSAATADAGPPRPTHRNSATEQVWSVLRTRIIDGDLPTGTRLTERALAAELGTGITPVREALAWLDHERLLVTRPRQGYVVPPVSWQDVRDAVDIWDLFGIHILERALEHATPEQVARIVTAMETEHPDPRVVVAERSRGWRLLAEAGGSPLVAEVLGMVNGLVARLFLVLRSRPDSPLPPTSLDWRGLFESRDRAAARDQLAGYLAALNALGRWAAEQAAVDGRR